MLQQMILLRDVGRMFAECLEFSSDPINLNCAFNPALPVKYNQLTGPYNFAVICLTSDAPFFKSK